MKKLSINCLVTACLLTLPSLEGTLAAGDVAKNGQPAAEVDLREHSGTVSEVNVGENKLVVESFWSTRTFNLSDGCKIALENDSAEAATLEDLRPGHHVEIRFKVHDGVRIATDITQNDQTFTGHITEVDATNRVFSVNRGWSTREFTLAENSEIIFRDETVHPLTDLEVGQRVTVVYLTPDDANVARLIRQESLQFTGRVEVLDSRADVVRAGTLLSDRTFHLGDGCQIVVNGQLGGELEDIRIGDRVTFSYEEIDGVLVANRIELEPASEEPETRQLSGKNSPLP